MHTRLSRVARSLYLAGIVLALVVVIPAQWFPFQLGKLALFMLVLLPVAILLAAGGGVRDMLRSHGFKLALLVGLLPLAYLLSWFFSNNPSIGFVGFGVETDTVLFTILGFVAFLLSFVFFRTLLAAHLLTRVVFWSAAVACVFQLIVVLFGTGLVPFEMFSDRSANLIGKWNDFGLMMSLLSLSALVMLELSPLSMVRRGILIALLLVATFLLSIINFALPWILLVVFSLAIAVVKFIGKKMSRETAEDPTLNIMAPSTRVPWYALTATVVALGFIFFGSSVNTLITSVLPIASLEVRPAYSSTLEVIAAQRASFGDTLVGTGPNTFGDAWLMHKPAEVNQTPFWNLDFNVGFSTLVTAFGSVGLIGVLAWFLPSILVILALLRAIRLGVLSREERVAAVTFGVSALFLSAIVIFYVPSQNILLLAFTVWGAAFGFLWRQGRSNVEAGDDVPRKGSIFAGAFALLLMLVSLWSVAVVERRALSTAFAQSSIAAANAGDYDTAISRAARARGVEEHIDSLRVSLDVGTAKLQQIASTEVTDATSAAAQQAFTVLAQETTAVGQRLAAIGDFDYRVHFAQARLYELLSALGIEGAYESARTSYETAAAKNPTNPAIPLALARLAASKNNPETAQTHVTQALTLKPNYTDAMLFVVQLSVAKNDLPSAIAAATAAAQTAPGVAPIWFQLGLLLYANGDITNAIGAFEQAVILVPDYANAKYFLGLSYADAKRTEEAIRQFEDIQRTNPDNSEVQIILGNLRLGKPAFEGVTPPPTAPEDRAEAPISE